MVERPRSSKAIISLANQLSSKTATPFHLPFHLPFQPFILWPMVFTGLNISNGQANDVPQPLMLTGCIVDFSFIMPFL